MNSTFKMKARTILNFFLINDVQKKRAYFCPMPLPTHTQNPNKKPLPAQLKTYQFNELLCPGSNHSKKNASAQRCGTCATQNQLKATPKPCQTTSSLFWMEFESAHFAATHGQCDGMEGGREAGKCSGSRRSLGGTWVEVLWAPYPNVWAL